MNNNVTPMKPIVIAYQFAAENGCVRFERPREMSQADAKDLIEWMEIVMRPVRKLAQTSERTPDEH